MGEPRDQRDVVTELWAIELRERLEAAIDGRPLWRRQAQSLLRTINRLRTPDEVRSSHDHPEPPRAA